MHDIELFTTWFGLSIICAYPVEDERVNFLAWSVSNIIFPPTRAMSIKISCDNGTYREFFIYITKKLAKIYAKTFKLKLLLLENLVIVIFCDFFDVLCNNYYYFEKKKFPIKRKQGVNNCFKPLISSIFTTVASQIKSVQKEKEK